ncbi:MAG: hypothetical protein BWY74_00927 [Firmicutes bacterium ADurb.Bin419]|jgi:hypothetical protein|nr:MAG: hypothetical protein BWY74_00927 [Firmicutes bacterium ADurb.Bin419]HHT18688.1 hypothetical protein [Methanobacterium sp.]
MQKSVLILIIGMVVLSLSVSGCLGGDAENTSSSDQLNDNSQLNNDNTENNDISDSKSINSKSKQQTCTECGGDGICWGCSGSGVDSEGQKCAVCGGNGVCPACSGTGMMATSQNG